MSQHWEDRDAEDRRAFLLVLFGADPRDVRTRTYGREVAIGLAIGLAIGVVILAAVLR
ncbi:MAG TPA: hypothetical protein VK752_05105 [Bryobacteraceae bacterium]|nr:hypothetical protein [Bryobacteraceae bacterium]